MTDRERFLNVLNFKKVDDRLPLVEWAAWWDKTTTRWEGEGMAKGMSFDESLQYFGLDLFHLISAGGFSSRTPRATTHCGAIITDEASYDAIKDTLFTDDIIENVINQAKNLKERHDKGEVIIRIWLDGFFWFPRTLFGVENHFYAFYDYPELMHRINNDLADFNIKVINALFPILKPDMVGFAEDMSYNHGPMLSYDLFKEFLMPYYKKVSPEIQKYGVKVMIDSDGDIYSMIPWMNEAGIEGVYPLERQAGVDINKIRKEYPEFLMLGGYDKMVMPLGEEAMRAEFERILPVMKSGGYIPSVDHQTPPGVSLENFRIYMKLFKEYAVKAVQ
ncbi:MAG: uroporphyrinogen decarboxylase family protein [Saccharofermentanales bacterium]